jgi:hypothetical protein
LSTLFFHDLRRSGARNFRKAGVDESVIMRIGGWKTPSTFRRYNIVDENDLAVAGERLAAFLHDGGHGHPNGRAARPDWRSPPAASRCRSFTEHAQFRLSPEREALVTY